MEWHLNYTKTFISISITTVPTRYSIHTRGDSADTWNATSLLLCTLSHSTCVFVRSFIRSLKQQQQQHNEKGAHYFALCQKNTSFIFKVNTH